MPDSNQLRQKIASCAKDRARAEEQQVKERREEAKHRESAAKYRAQASKAASVSQAKSYLGSAGREESAATTHAGRAVQYGKEAARQSGKEAGYQKDLARAIEQEMKRAASERQQEATQLKRSHEHEMASLQRSIADAREAERSWTVDSIEQAIVSTRPPKAEALRVLYVTANADGDLLRVEEELRQVKSGVRASTHRDLVEIYHLPAATPEDLLDGLTRHLPHVVHFSGHASQDALVFDTGGDSFGLGQHLEGELFARALRSLDEPPQLVVLNACDSHGHVTWLEAVVPFLITMTASIGDPDAITFAKRFYATIAEGRSIASAVEVARTHMLFNGLPDAHVPHLNVRADADSAQRLVIAPST
jgi:CHAT domain